MSSSLGHLGECAVQQLQLVCAERVPGSTRRLRCSTFPNCSWRRFRSRTVDAAIRPGASVKSPFGPVICRICSTLRSRFARAASLRCGSTDGIAGLRAQKAASGGCGDCAGALSHMQLYSCGPTAHVPCDSLASSAAASNARASACAAPPAHGTASPSVRTALAGPPFGLCP